MLRWAVPSDYDALGKVMYDAVRTGRSLYSEAQRKAWMPQPNSGPKWHSRLAAQHVLMDEGDTGLTGFLSLDDSGYIDLAFIHPAAQGSGLFRSLATEIVATARENGLPCLRTHASLMAQPAFAAMGFAITQREVVQISGLDFHRAEMHKLLT
jgi:putative acetyltransferase